MQEDLTAIQNNPARAIYCSQRLLCRTLAGNNVYILTVTSPGTAVSNRSILKIMMIRRMSLDHLDKIIDTSSYNFSLQEDLKNKSIIVLTARVHPGETPSSWIMRGILHFITGSSEFANELRQRFIFKVTVFMNIYVPVERKK